jgi:protein transport protein SEC24
VTDSPTSNADPSFQRCTLTAIPTSESLLKKSKLPFALVITPFRSISPSEPPVPVIQDCVIARCRRCRAYINPFVTFIDGGSRWKCILCNVSNEVPALFDWDELAKKPADRWKRHELNHATVDFLAPREYMVRPPQPVFYVFLVDVGPHARQSGMVAVVARAIAGSLDKLPNSDGSTRVAFVAFDDQLHFFHITPTSAEFTMMVVSDVDDVYLPRPTDLLVNLQECRTAVDALLSKFEEIFGATHASGTGSAMGPALQAGFQLIVCS